jgi:RimJ/RimL family protein N-acetyltransferase
MNVALESFEPSHFEFLKKWLSSAHVQPWYPDPERDIRIATSPPSGGFHAIIVVDHVPVGYVRWQYVDRETLDELGLQQIPESSVDIDILIGEETQTAKGVGPRALELLAKRLLADPNVPTLGLTTSVHNFKAQRAFAKAGFVILLQYDPTGHGLCHLMVRDLQKERQRAANHPGV